MNRTKFRKGIQRNYSENDKKNNILKRPKTFFLEEEKNDNRFNK